MLKHVSASLRDVFKAKVVVDDHDCWIWSNIHSTLGYGIAYSLGRRFYAHRLAYELFVGVIPDDLELDHLCRNRGCCNPQHLEAVSHKVNALRGNGCFAQRARGEYLERRQPADACRAGHPRTPENIYIYQGRGRQSVYCRVCKREGDRARAQRAIDTIGTSSV